MPTLGEGLGYTVQEITNLVNETLPANSQVHSYEIKDYLLEHHGNKIEFSKSKNKSPIVFSSSLTKFHLIEKIRSMNIYKECGLSLKKILNDIDFNLNDKFCIVTDLKNSWEQINIPMPVLDFLSGLMDFKKSSFLKFLASENNCTNLNESNNTDASNNFQSSENSNNDTHHDDNETSCSENSNSDKNSTHSEGEKC